MRDYKKELIEDLSYARQNDLKIALVEANQQKGFNYSYFIYIPNNPQNILMMDCLNDYEEEMPEGHIENLEGIIEVHSIFPSNEIIKNDYFYKNGNEKEEEKDNTLYREYYRLEKGLDALSNMIKINPDAPAIVPLVPGFR